MKFNNVKKEAAALADECERLANQYGDHLRAARSPLQKSEALEAQSIYYQMAADWRATALRAEELRPTSFTGQNKGVNPKTQLRLDFLETVARERRVVKQIALAAMALDQPHHAKKAALLWKCKPAERQAKILNFLRNHSKKLSLKFEN